MISARPSPLLRCAAPLGSMVLACAALASPAAAQDAGALPEDDSEIIVSGTAEDEARARSYVTAVQPASWNVQAARWTDPICIGVSGTTRPIAERLAGRINTAASEIGARISQPGCKPNLLVIFSKDASSYMAKMRRTSATRLAEIPRNREDFVFGKTAPIRWWYNTDVLDRDGSPLTAGTTGMVQCAGPCAIPSLGPVRSQATYSSSRIQSPTIRHIKSAVVVIDMPLAAGRAIDSLGDYAALVSLAEVWPNESTVPTGSILGLFRTPPADPSDAPLLTAMDRRFLCELYRLPLARSGQYQRGFLLSGLSSGLDRCPT